MVDAQREMALLRSGLESEWDSQARRRLIGDAHARLQYGEVTEVTELTTVVQIVTVEQTGCCCGCSNDTECKNRSRGGQSDGETDEPSLHRTMSGFGSGLDKAQKRGRHRNWLPYTPFHAILRALMGVNQR